MRDELNPTDSELRLACGEMHAAELRACRAGYRLALAGRSVAVPDGVDILRIPAGDKLDSIIVYFEDEGAGKGRMTVACYGDAWTAWWGSMGDRTVRQFVAGADPGYLSGAMCKLRAANGMHRDYAWRVAARVISALTAAPPPPAAQPIAHGDSERGCMPPVSRDVGRIGDMSLLQTLRIGFDADSDIVVSVCDEDGFASVEFCVPGFGGGKSPRTREALIALMVAIEADNAETPSRDWWAVRNTSTTDRAKAEQEGGDA